MEQSINIAYYTLYTTNDKLSQQIYFVIAEYTQQTNSKNRSIDPMLF